MTTATAAAKRVSLGTRLWSLVSSRETGIFLALALVVIATTVSSSDNTTMPGAPTAAAPGRVCRRVA